MSSHLFNRVADFEMPVRPPLEVTGIADHEWAPLVAWLDDSLRRGERGRLVTEYPVSLCHKNVQAHRVVRSGTTILSHAMFHTLDLRIPEPFRAGMIGLVYTDPVERAQGLARLCIEACVEELERRGVAMALLWSDKPEYYARLGFVPVGRETRWAVDSGICRAARRILEKGMHARALPVDRARPSDWTILERLYAAKRHRAMRSPGSLEALAAAPDTSLVVARRGRSKPTAYAALGRGDDLQGVIHEWAGPARDVLACFEQLCGERGPLLVHAGPEPGPLGAALLSAGAPTDVDSFALGRILDESQIPPHSLYLWGFDSI